MTSLHHRRKFLRFLAGSPLLAQAYAQEAGKAASPKDILTVTELEELAHRALPPAHWGYVSWGVDDNFTLQANIGAFRHIGLRPKRLSGVDKAETGTEIFGVKYDSPLYVSAVGGKDRLPAKESPNH